MYEPSDAVRNPKAGKAMAHKVLKWVKKIGFYIPCGQGSLVVGGAIKACHDQGTAWPKYYILKEE